MSSPTGGFTPAFITQQAELMEALAQDEPDKAEYWQAQANAWRIELPPEEIEPTEPAIDADFWDIDP